MGKLRQLLSTLFLTATFLTTCALAQNNLTQIRDTIYNADGTPFNGTVVITWNGYSTTVSGTISPLSTSARIYNGALSVLLVPTTTAAAGSFYQIVYSSSDGTTMWTETWQVPPSSNALSVSGVRTSSATGSGSGSGSGSGTGTGSTQYATLPISMSQVTGLGTSLSALNTSLTSLSTTVTALSTTVSGLSSGSGSALSLAFVDAELPAGNMNGVNTVFTLTQNPSPLGSLVIYRNGIAQASGVDYTVSGHTLTFLTAGIPKTGDILQAFYRVAGATTPIPVFSDAEVPAGVINGTNLTFTLANAPNPALSLRLHKNGMLLQQNGDYTLTGSTITFVNAVTPQTGDSLVAYYRH